MTVSEAERTGGPLTCGVNPAARLLSILVIAVPPLITLDVVSATVTLVMLLLLAPACGVGWGRLARRAWPLALATPVAGLSMALYGRPGGDIHLEAGPIVVSDNSLLMAAAVMIRVLAVALPVLILSADVDPTDLGDALAQVLHLPERAVIAAVAGSRLITLFHDDWRAMARARRARGIADSGRIKNTLTMAFALLVLALRRGGKLATAMEARGFGREVPGGRTWARPSAMGRRDLVLIAVCAVVPLSALSAAILTGQFRWFGI